MGHRQCRVPCRGYSKAPSPQLSPPQLHYIDPTNAEQETLRQGASDVFGTMLLHTTITYLSAYCVVALTCVPNFSEEFCPDRDAASRHL